VGRHSPVPGGAQTAGELATTVRGRLEHQPRPPTHRRALDAYRVVRLGRMIVRPDVDPMVMLHGLSTVLVALLAVFAATGITPPSPPRAEQWRADHGFVAAQLANACRWAGSCGPCGSAPVTDCADGSEYAEIMIHAVRRPPR
jgi:hypothetical protein